MAEFNYIIEDMPITHGATIGGRHTREYRAWSDMKTRCYNSNRPQYKDYGGRGIKVCESWVHSFETFLADMGPCPEGLTLDRVDNDKDYGPAFEEIEATEYKACISAYNAGTSYKFLMYKQLK